MLATQCTAVCACLLVHVHVLVYVHVLAHVRINFNQKRIPWARGTELRHCHVHWTQVHDALRQHKLVDAVSEVVDVSRWGGELLLTALVALANTYCSSSSLGGLDEPVQLDADQITAVDLLTRHSVSSDMARVMEEASATGISNHKGKW